MRPCLLLVIALVMAPVVGHGDGRDQARTLFIRGQEHFDRGQYRMAIEEFRQSYALSPRPLLLYDMGLAALELSRRDEALGYLHRFLATSDDVTSERRKAETLVAKLEREHHAPPTPATEPPPAEPAPAPAPATVATTTAPAPQLTAPPTTTPTTTTMPASAATERPDVVSAAPAATAKQRARRRNLIIGFTAGAIVVAGGAIALGVVFGTSNGPVPTIGSGPLQ